MFGECWKCKSGKGYVRSARNEIFYCLSCGSVADYSSLREQDANGDVRMALDPAKKRDCKRRIAK